MNTDQQSGRDTGFFTLSATQWLPRPMGKVFTFVADAGNLDTLTLAWLQFEILTPRPLEMKVGARIDYRLRLRGLAERDHGVATTGPVRG